MKTNLENNNIAQNKLKPIRFYHENGTTTFIQTEYPEEMVMGDLWLDPNEDEWARVNFEFYNKIESYDNRLY